MNSQNVFTRPYLKQFLYYKGLAEKAMNQLTEEELYWKYNEESNSIAIIVNHLWGNMLSRWTNFLSEDGEKSWRNRDSEFEETIKTRSELLGKWNEGWQLLIDTLESLNEEHKNTIVYIRNEGHTVEEAIIRQMNHYISHIGQIIYIAKMIRSGDWKSLSIPKSQSENYNTRKFSEEKGIRHFTDDFLDSNTS